MKRIWAPWRIEYILQSKKEGCFLCDIVDDDRDRNNLLLKRHEHVYLLMNRYPYNNGHLMVAPYRHISTLEDLDPDESDELMKVTREAVRTLKKSIRADGFNIGMNLGKVAGAGLEDHLHMHIVPRWNGDTNFMPVTGETKVMPQDLCELWDQLHPAFNA